jgi:FtsH-binding integral membrane protein
MGGDGAKFLTIMYQNTPMRAVPYLVGMVLGYVLSEKIQVSLNKAAVFAGWCLSTGLCLSVIFTILIPYSFEYKYDRLDAAFYAGLHKFGWSVGIAWIIWACVNGYGGKSFKLYFSGCYIHFQNRTS